MLDKHTDIDQEIEIKSTYCIYIFIAMTMYDSFTSDRKFIQLNWHTK